MVTAVALMAIYQSPHVPLREVCERYFSLSYEEALRKGCRNELPVPTFRLTSSRKSPLLVSCQELGDYIDAQAAAAKASWLHSQV